MSSELRAARYLRVSRSDQNINLQSDETQQMIERRGWILSASYHDQGISGSKDRRPQLDRMMQAARRREFDVLVVYRADRLFRSLKHLVTTIDELSALGVDFVSCTEPFDTCTPQGRLMLHLVSAFSEFERGVLIERTKAGLDAARRRGKRLGRPQVYVDVAKATRLRAQGMSYAAVAKSLGVSVGRLHKALNNPESASSSKGAGSVTAGA